MIDISMLIARMTCLCEGKIEIVWIFPSPLDVHCDQCGRTWEVGLMETLGPSPSSKEEE